MKIYNTQNQIKFYIGIIKPLFSGLLILSVLPTGNGFLIPIFILKGKYYGRRKQIHSE